MFFSEPPKSILSAEAKEWYPRNYVPQNQVSYGQEHYRVPRYSAQDRIRQAQEQDPYNFEDMSYSLDEPESALRVGTIHKLIKITVLDCNIYDWLTYFLITKRIFYFLNFKYENSIINFILLFAYLWLYKLTNNEFYKGSI